MRRNGYTLVELLIVMAIIAMVAGLGVPYFARSMERSEVKNAAHEMAALIRLARNEAVARKSYFTVIIDPAQKAAYSVEGRYDPEKPQTPFNGEVVELPGSVKVWTPDDKPLPLELSPAGTASACDLPVTGAKADFADDPDGYRLTVDPLSGRPRVLRNVAGAPSSIR